jgi:hypothetical protein
VTVPGGQQIYVPPNGEIGYTMPHSAFVPPGSTFGGFFVTYQTCPESGEPVMVVNWASTVSADFAGLFCCPSPVGDRNDTWVVRARTPDAIITPDCMGMAGLKMTMSQEQVSAYQYA